MAVDSKKIHQHLQSISRINTTLALLSLLAVVVLFAWLKLFVVPNQHNTAVSEDAKSGQVVQTTVNANSNSAANENAKSTAAATAELTENYRVNINEILGDYDFSDSEAAEQILYEVLELRVPAELKQFHLQVVLALNQSQQGNYDSAVLQISKLQDQFGWFLAE